MTERFQRPTKPSAVRWLALLALALAAACTVQERYDAVRRGQLDICDRQVTERLQEECRQRLEEAMPESHQDYERQRRRLPTRAEAGSGRFDSPPNTVAAIPPSVQILGD